MYRVTTRALDQGGVEPRLAVSLRPEGHRQYHYTTAPAGYQDLYVDYPDLLGNNWIAEARNLWPFRDWTAAFWFVPGGVYMDDMNVNKPVLHFVVSYVTDILGCPILVRQRMNVVNDMTAHMEYWAVVAPLEADYAVMRSAIDRHPFWFHPQVRTHLSRDESG